MWAEVWVPRARGGGGRARWVAADPVHSACDVPDDILRRWAQVGRQRRDGYLPPYVVAVTCHPMLRVVDVSGRYLLDYATVYKTQKRVSEEWWTSYLQTVSVPGQGAVVEMETADDAEIQAKVRSNARERLPETKAACKRNSHFTMKSLLKKDECLKPQAPRVGLIDGEAVYNASDVCQVRTVLGWKKEKQPRSVKPGEGAVSKRKKRQPKASLGAAGAQEPPPQEEEELFAEWQTEPYVPPAVVDGKIPVNEHGNVELWGNNAALLPRGCRQIDAPYIQRTCRRLDIKYAEAMIGFSYKRGVTEPTFKGIVVCEGDYDRLVSEHAKDMAKSAAKKEEKERQKLFKRWAELIKLAVYAKRVQEEYQ